MLDQSAAQLQEIIAVTPPPFRTGLGWFVQPLMQFIPCVAETFSTYSTLSSHLGTARLSLHSIWSFPLFSPGRTGSSQPLVHTWQKLEKDIYIYGICYHPPKPTAQKIQMLIDVSRNLCLEKMILFGMILSLPSIIHQIPTQYSVCDQHSVLLSKSAIVDANCYIPGKKYCC